MERHLPSLEDLGIPNGRGGMGISTGGGAGPGTPHGIELYAFGEDLEVDRDVTIRLMQGDELLEEASASVGRLRAARPFLLQVRLPKTAPATYRLQYEISSSAGAVGSYAFEVQVPEQRLNVQLTCTKPIARPGELVDLVMRNSGPSTAFFGSEYAVERSDGKGGWRPVPWDEDAIWTLIGYSLAPGGTFQLSAEIPQRTEPGRHRVVKDVGMEHGSEHLRLLVEIDVV